MPQIENVYRIKFTQQYVTIENIMTGDKGKFHRTGEYKTGFQFVPYFVKSILNYSYKYGRLTNNIQVYGSYEVLRTSFD